MNFGDANGRNPLGFNYTLGPRRRGRGMRVAAFIIVGLAVAALYFQIFRPRYSSARKDTIPWQTNLAEALAQSKQTGRPVLVDFSAEWCPPCQEMKHAAWPDPKVEAAAKSNYIPVLLDVDHAEAEAQRYHIETIPQILVLDAEGKVLRRADFLSKEELLRFLKGREP